MKLAWVDGEMVPEDGARVSVMDRGFTLGDGVFETVRAVGGRVFRLEEHLSRLELSAKTIGLEVPVDRADLGNAIGSVLGANGLPDALVRVTVSRGIASRGLMPPDMPSPTVVIVATVFDGRRRAAHERGYRVVISSIRRNEHSPLSRIKSCNYLDSLLARMEAATQGVDDALLLNTAGNLACASSSNVFVVSDGALLTPDLESGVLDGVTRRAVLEIAEGSRIPCEQRAIAVDELGLAEEVFVTNTALGVMPVVEIGGEWIGGGRPGPVCRLLGARYEGLVGRG